VCGHLRYKRSSSTYALRCRKSGQPYFEAQLCVRRDKWHVGAFQFTPCSHESCAAAAETAAAARDAALVKVCESEGRSAGYIRGKLNVRL
jgi:hypothetical protein